MNLTKAQLAQKVRELEAKYDSADRARKELNLLLTEKQKRIEYLERQKDDLKAAGNACEEARSEIQEDLRRVKDNLSFSEKKRAELEADYEQLDAIRQKLNNLVSEKQNRIEDLEADNAKLVHIKNHHEAEARKWFEAASEWKESNEKLANALCKARQPQNVADLEAKIASLEAQLADARDTADRMAGDLKKYKEFYDDQRAKHWGWNNQKNTIRNQQALIKGKDALINKLRKDIEELNKKQSIKEALKSAVEAMGRIHEQHVNINISKKLNEILEAVKPKEKGVGKSNGPGEPIVIDDPKVSGCGTLPFGAKFTPPQWLRKIEVEREKAAEKDNEEPTLEDYVKTLSELYTALRKSVANDHILILNLQSENERLRAMCEDLRKNKADKWRLW